MSIDEYVKKLDRDQLHYLLAAAQERQKELSEAGKIEILVVSDACMNLGFFKRNDIEGAMKCMVKEAQLALRYNRDYLQVQVQRWFEYEVADLIGDNKL